MLAVFVFRIAALNTTLRQTQRAAEAYGNNVLELQSQLARVKKDSQVRSNY